MYYSVTFSIIRSDQLIYLRRLESYDQNADFGGRPGDPEPCFKMVTPPLTEYKDVNADTQVGISYATHGNYSCGT